MLIRQKSTNKEPLQTYSIENQWGNHIFCRSPSFVSIVLVVLNMGKPGLRLFGQGISYLPKSAISR